MDEQFPTPEHGQPEYGQEFEAATQVDAEEIVTSLVQLIEAKALAQRLAYKALVRELTSVAGPDVAFRVQAHLDAVRCDSALLTQDDDGLQANIAQELSLLIDELDSLVSGS